MNIVKHPNNTGFIDDEILLDYPSFSFLESVRMGGVGSPKVYYKGGIAYFDEVIGEHTDLPMVNFELRQHVMFVRLSIHQKKYTVSVDYEEIQMIGLIDSTVTPKIKYAPFYGIYNSKIELSFLVKLILKDGKEVLLATNNLKVTSFFKKSIFENKLTLISNHEE